MICLTLILLITIQALILAIVLASQFLWKPANEITKDNVVNENVLVSYKVDYKDRWCSQAKQIKEKFSMEGTILKHHHQPRYDSRQFEYNSKVIYTRIFSSQTQAKSNSDSSSSSLSWKTYTTTVVLLVLFNSFSH